MNNITRIDIQPAVNVATAAGGAVAVGAGAAGAAISGAASQVDVGAIGSSVAGAAGVAGGAIVAGASAAGGAISGAASQVDVGAIGSSVAGAANIVADGAVDLASQFGVAAGDLIDSEGVQKILGTGFGLVDEAFKVDMGQVKDAILNAMGIAMSGCLAVLPVLRLEIFRDFNQILSLFVDNFFQDNKHFFGVIKVQVLIYILCSIY